MDTPRQTPERPREPVPAPPSSSSADRRSADPEVTRLRERERQLRSLLLDARDQLQRSQLADSPSRPQTPPRGDSSAHVREEQPLRDSPSYTSVRDRLRVLVDGTVSRDGRVAVVSRGDRRLLELGEERSGIHFPADDAGRYAGHHPADDEAALAALEQQRRNGVDHLVFPETSRWWLDHYRGFADTLERHHRKLADHDGVGVIYRLEPEAPGSRREPEAIRPSLDVDTVEAPAITTSAVRSNVETRTGTPSVRPERRPFAAATIISRNYLAQARVLALSFLEHEPDSRFYLLVVDRLPDGVELGIEAISIDPEELAVPSFFKMCFKYGVVELATAVKPFLLALLMDEYDEAEVVYFDPDILVARPLAELRGALSQGDIVLTPHITKPLPLDGKRPSEQDIMISGAYNLGFIALRRSAESRRFLRWWQERLEDGCRIDVSHGLFTDQKWIDLVPSLFSSTVILRDPTYNVAFWNLHERTITEEDGFFQVNGRPGAFFHISGFDPKAPDRLSKHQSRIEIDVDSALGRLLEDYGDRLLVHGHEETSAWEYGYERFANGLRVHPLLRQIYLHLSPEERDRFGDPFVADGEADRETFLEWATRPDPELGGLSRFLDCLHRARYDLPLAFPDARGRDRPAFLRWARKWGSSEMGFDPALVRDAQVETEGRPARPQNGTAPVEEVTARAATVPTTRAAPNSYEAVIERIRAVVRGTLPAGSKVLVISKGDYRLLDLGGCEGQHFPQAEGGVYGGFNPPDSEVAVAHLEALRAQGADYLLVPQTGLWWLEYYDDFRRHLDRRYRLVLRSHDTCHLYSLREHARSADAERPVSGWRRWLERVPSALRAGASS